MKLTTAQRVRARREYYQGLDEILRIFSGQKTYKLDEVKRKWTPSKKPDNTRD